MLKEIVSPDASFVALPQAEKTEGEALFGQSFKGSLVPTKVFLDISIHSPIHSCLISSMDKSTDIFALTVQDMTPVDCMLKLHSIIVVVTIALFGTEVR
jgi:hypothetical protein